MRNLFRFCPLLLAFALILVAEPAFAAKRVALVLANSAYQNAPPLANPVNDGSVIAKTLKQAGFDVVDFRHDLPALEIVTVRSAIPSYEASGRCVPSYTRCS